MSDCCTDPDCRRTQPILLRRDPFSDRWVVVTRYTKDGNTIRASEKHILDGQAQHMLGGAFVAPGEEEQDRVDAVRHSAAAVRTLMRHLGLDPDRRTASGYAVAMVLAAAALNIPIGTEEDNA